jgi:hypothetical protein
MVNGRSCQLCSGKPTERQESVGLSRVPCAAERWRSSNDSRWLNSNSALRHAGRDCCHSQREISMDCSALSSCVSVLPGTFFLPLGRSLRPSTRHCKCARTPPPRTLTTSANFYPPLAPFNLYKARVRCASGFLGMMRSQFSYRSKYSRFISEKGGALMTGFALKCP